MNLKKPFFWDLPKPNIISYILTPFTIPIMLRNFFLDYFIKKKNYKIKTICVGNIYLGGTGKTPLTIKIFEILKKLNHKVATVKKYHKNQIDEQLLLEQKTTLIISKSRKTAVLKALQMNYETLVFDDGLQDADINFDKKIVCFKTNSWIGNGQLIPSGPLREKIESLKKYDVVFLNGIFDNNEIIKNQIKSINSKIKIFESKYEVLDLKKYNLNAKYLIFSGIGNPSDFKNLLLENKFKISKEITFPDHFNYKDKDLEKIINIANQQDLKILTTEKDYVKIPKKYKNKIEYLAIDLVIKNKDDFFKLLIN